VRSHKKVRPLFAENTVFCTCGTTMKPSKLGQTDLVFSFWTAFISRSLHV